MTKIHMKTDEVRETARLLDWTAGELYYAPFKLKNLASSIASAWQGGKSARYAAELRRQGELLQREVINLQRLARRVSNEVNQWEEADATHDFKTTASPYANTTGEGLRKPNDPEGIRKFYADQLRNTIQQGSIGMATGAVVGGSMVVGNAQNGGEQQGFNWWKVGGGSLKITKGVTRLLEASKIIDKAPWMKGLPILGFGVGIASDLQSGDSVEQAVVSESIEAGIKMIPGIGWVFIGWDVVLGTGYVISAFIELGGNHTMAKRLQNSFDELDVLDGFADNMAENMGQNRGMRNITSMTTVSI